MVSELRPSYFTTWLASRLDLGDGNSIWDRDMDADLSLSPVRFPIPISAQICYLELEVLCESFETPTPPPTLREAGPREAGLAGGGLRCSRAEKRCPAVAGHAAGERGAFRGA